jgi:enamine deaminase RidA (YjgF/YER057c/UK114 family)
VNRGGAVNPLGVCELGSGRIPFARGMAAGDWVFATGVVASDFATGLAQGVQRPELPNAGRPRHCREAIALLERAQTILRAGGSDLTRCVRLDQYYPRADAVAFYQSARRAAFGAYIAPSTSILEQALILPEASIEVEFLALRTDCGIGIETFYPAELEVPAGAGFAPVVRAGDFVFVAGMLAAWKPGDLGGIAPEARMPEGHLWKGVPIKLQADYIMARKIEPALAAAGASMDDVVKVQVYLSAIDDIPAFNEVWDKWLANAQAVRTFIPTARPGFAIAEARVEINVIAVRGGNQRRRAVATEVFTPYAHDPVAVRAGDLLLISGLLAIDAHGAIPGTTRDSAQPWFSSPIETQMEHILTNAESICRSAGTSLANCVRIQQFHTDLAEFYPACKVWQRYLPNTPLPLSAIEVPAPLPVPGCSIEIDLWVYAPEPVF